MTSLPSPFDRATAAVFHGLSAARGRQVAHPHGIGFAAAFTPQTAGRWGAEAFDQSDPIAAVVRLSRSVGLPEALPDPCGLAIRLLHADRAGRDQDLLLVSSASGRLTRHLLAPARGFGSCFYSTLLPYRIGGQRALIGAQPLGRSSRLRLRDLRRHPQLAPSFRLVIARPGTRWESLARLELGAVLAADATRGLRFDPSRTSQGIEPAGLINRLRVPAYAGSQAARQR